MVVDGEMDGWVGRWIVEWVERWMNGWMDGWVCGMKRHIRACVAGSTGAPTAFSSSIPPPYESILLHDIPYSIFILLIFQKF